MTELLNIITHKEPSDLTFKLGFLFSDEIITLTLPWTTTKEELAISLFELAADLERVAKDKEKKI